MAGELCSTQQRFDRPRVIACFAIPPSRGGVVINLQSLFFMFIDQLMPIAQRLRMVGQRAVEGLTIGFDEPDCAIVEYEHDDVAFVDLSMVEATDAYEIGELRFAAVGPMFNVMAVEIASVRAAGETTAAFVA